MSFRRILSEVLGNEVLGQLRCHRRSSNQSKLQYQSCLEHVVSEEGLVNNPPPEDPSSQVTVIFSASTTLAASLNKEYVADVVAAIVASPDTFSSISTHVCSEAMW